MPFSLIEILLLLAAAGMFVRVAWTDFNTLLIANRDVAIILGLGLLYSGLYHYSELPQRMAISAFLFAVPFVFWIFRTVGAGDVKLMGSVGFVVGFENAFLFVIGVLLVSLIMLMILRISSNLTFLPSAVLKRFATFLDKGHVPYGVPIAISAIIVIIKIFLSGLSGVAAP